MEKGIKNKESSITSRRSFVKKIWGFFGLLAGAELLFVGSSFFAPGRSGNKQAGSKLIVAGKISDFEPGSVFPFRNGQFYLVRFDNGGFMAVSLKCTHLGCSVLWDDAKNIFNCPCHASSFDKYGDVISPPAPRPLDTFPVIFEEGLVKVNVASPGKRKEFNNSQVVFA